jgi:2'-5' RNA ligase
MVTEKGNVYYLWLTPAGDAHNRFAEVIRKLSQTYHTKLFDPHITLVGGITGSEAELIAKTEKLSRRLTRITIKPQEVKYLNEFYRSLFLLVTPAEALINANKLAKQLFGLPLDEEFMPHLSLFYGELSVKEKEKIKGKLNSKLLTPFHVDNIVLFCTSNEPNEWYPVQSFPLATKV